MEAIDKLHRGRIGLQRQNPFFSILSLHLKFKEDTKTCKDNNGLAYITPKGVFGYDKDAVKKMSDSDIKSLICHEVIHLAFLHLVRRKNRHPQLWNIAVDLATNTILEKNGFILIDGSIRRNNNNEFKFKGITIKDCDTKNAEQIYDELSSCLNNENEVKQNDNGESNGESNGEETDGESNGKSFDTHIFGDGESNGKKLTEQELQELEKEWLGKVNEALVSSKMRGNTPKGIEEMISDLTKSQIGWKRILRKHIENSLVSDHTYATPNKKSVSSGYYMPNYVKEKISVVVGIDVSGSISQKDLTDFVSEIVGMSDEFRNQMEVRILTHDTKVYTDELITNSNKKKICSVKLVGGGGTSHKELFEKVKKYKPKVCIFFSDNESDVEEIDFKKYAFEKIFVITKNGVEMERKDCISIKLK